MTTKQKKFVLEYIRNGGNGVQAALAVYDTKDYNTANQIALANLQSPTVIREIKRNLEDLGVTSEFLDESLREIIETGLANKDRTKPADALNAIVVANKLLDRFPTERRLVAQTNLSTDLETLSNKELKEILFQVQKDNQRLILQVQD